MIKCKITYRYIFNKIMENWDIVSANQKMMNILENNSFTNRIKQLNPTIDEDTCKAIVLTLIIILLRKI